LCAPGDLVEHFHLWTSGRKREEKEEEKTRSRREWEERNGAQIIMDLEIEKSETSRCEVHERAVRIYEYIRVYARASLAGHLLVMSYFVPRPSAITV